MPSPTLLAMRLSLCTQFGLRAVSLIINLQSKPNVFWATDETSNSRHTSCPVITSYSIRIQKLAENRPVVGFTHGFPYGFPPMKYLNHDKRTRCGNQTPKSGHGKKRGKGGSDPTLAAFQPSRTPWDRSRPFSNSLARVPQEQTTKPKGEDHVHH